MQGLNLFSRNSILAALWGWGEVLSADSVYYVHLRLHWATLWSCLSLSIAYIWRLDGFSCPPHWVDKSEWEVSSEKHSGCSVFQLNNFSFTRTSFLRASRKANMNFLTRTGHIFPLRPKISSQSCWFVMPKNDSVLLKFCNIHGFKEYVSPFILRVILLPKWQTSVPCLWTFY